MVTEVYFVVNGANLILDDRDQVVRINDATTFRDRYLRLCAEQGKPRLGVRGLTSDAT